MREWPPISDDESAEFDRTDASDAVVAVANEFLPELDRDVDVVAPDTPATAAEGAGRIAEQLI